MDLTKFEIATSMMSWWIKKLHTQQKKYIHVSSSDAILGGNTGEVKIARCICVIAITLYSLCIMKNGNEFNSDVGIVLINSKKNSGQMETESNRSNKPNHDVNCFFFFSMKSPFSITTSLISIEHEYELVHVIDSIWNVENRLILHIQTSLDWHMCGIMYAHTYVIGLNFQTLRTYKVSMND